MRRCIIALLVMLIVIPACTPALAEEINWNKSWDKAVKSARDENKPILILFTCPERCQPCRMLVSQTLVNEAVIKYINKMFVPLLINTGHRENQAISQEFGIRGIPTIKTTNPEKEVIAERVGFVNAEGLLKFLKGVVSLQELEQKIKAKPEDPQLNYKLGETYLDVGKTERGKGYLQKVLELDKANREGLKIHALFKLARLDLETGKPEEAKQKYQEIEKLDPEDKAGYQDDIALKLAILPASQEDYAKAVESLEKFMNNFPQSELKPEALYYLSICQYKLQQISKCRETLEKLVKEFSDTAYGKGAKTALEQLPKAEK